MIKNEVVERIDHFIYLESLINHDSMVSDEISARIRRARFGFADLRHLLRGGEIRLPKKGELTATQ